jgi:uncharacterized CHY-type Zn-finger protein
MKPFKVKAAAGVAGLAALFLALAAAFLTNLWGRQGPLPQIALVDPQFTNTATVRTNLADLMRAKADLSDFDCYGCHERSKPPQLRYDKDHKLVIPKEHDDIVMQHGRHDRNNNCFNCHNETNLTVLQTRDGRELKMEESPALCGSCHGPTYRDWEAGVHGRTSGYWNRQLGSIERKQCVSCHNPHSPTFPGRKPAPGPHPLRPGHAALAQTEENHGK